MNHPQPLRYTLWHTGQTYEVIDTTTGAVVFTGDHFAAARERGRLELAARPQAQTSSRKAKRLAEIAEKRQAGV